jgi:hypothetical protein
MLLTPPEAAERLRARLGMRDDGGPDGISCRDESIDSSRDSLRYSVRPPAPSTEVRGEQASTPTGSNRIRRLGELI